MSTAVVDVPLHTAASERYLNYALSVITSRALPEAVNGARLRALYADCYAGEPFVGLASGDGQTALEQIDPESLNGTNELRLHVLSNDKRGQAIVVAQLDNLGKGASGQAVQTLNLLVGADERTGL